MGGLTGACARPSLSSLEFEMLSFRAGLRWNFDVEAVTGAAAATVVAAETGDSEESMEFEVVDEEDELEETGA